MQLTDAQIENLGKKLETDVPGIRFAYIFGSMATGTSKEGSDIDVAVFLDSGYDRFEIISKILSSLERAIPGFQADLNVLNDASPILSMEALKGRRLFVRKDAEDLHAEFYSLTCRKYEDQMAWMEKQLKYRGYEVQWGDRK